MRWRGVSVEALFLYPLRLAHVHSGTLTLTYPLGAFFAV